MKNSMQILVAAAVMAAWSSTPASAQTSSWSVSFDIGGQVPAGGDVHGGGAGTVLGLPTQVAAKSYRDVYGSGPYWAAGFGYRIAERGEIRVQGSYTDTTAQRLQVGTVAGLPLLGLFDDYEAFGMDVGYRHYLSGGWARPFVGAKAGFARLETVRSEFSVPAAAVVLPDVDFLESSLVPALGFEGGVQLNVSDRLAVQGGIDFRWHGDAKDRDGLAGTGLERINDQSRRWSMPVTGGVTVRF